MENLNVENVEKITEEEINSYYENFKSLCLNENGKLKDDYIINSLGLNNINDLKGFAPLMFDKVCDDKYSAQRNIVYYLALIEEISKEIEELKADNENDNSEIIKEKVIKMSELEEEIASTLSTLELSSKSISILARYIDAY